MPTSLSWLFFLSIMGVTDFNLRNASGFLRSAISAYVLVGIVKKGLAVEATLYTTLQILSLTLSEKTSLIPLLNNSAVSPVEDDIYMQLNLFT